MYIGHKNSGRLLTTGMLQSRMVSAEVFASVRSDATRLLNVAPQTPASISRDTILVQINPIERPASGVAAHCRHSSVSAATFASG